MVITAIDDMVKYGSVLLQSRCPRDAASVYARELVDAITKAGGPQGLWVVGQQYIDKPKIT